MFCHVCIDDKESNDICENKMYVQDWKHTKLNTKGKMSVATFEEMKSEETTISSDGDRVSDLTREGNIQLLSNDKDLEIDSKIKYTS